jgi:ABC-2 type transport system ATP-binding protein
MREDGSLILEAVHLGRSCGAGAALHPISLSVRKGEIFGILGPPGSGKTTLFNVLSGKAQPSSGQLRIRGKDFWRNERELRRLVGTVAAPEHDPNTPGLEYTAREHLNFEAGLIGVSHEKYRDRIDGVLSRVGLATYDNLRVAAFPGEMRRRLALARALLIDPLLVIIDEPTAGVEEGHRQLIWRLLRSLQNEGKTIVLTTSSWQEVQEVCNRVATFDQGVLLDIMAP